MKGQRTSVAATIVIALVVLLIATPVIYIISAGPALWLVNHGYLDAMTYLHFYQPPMAYAYHHPKFNDAMNWYLSWWGAPINPYGLSP